MSLAICVSLARSVLTRPSQKRIFIIATLETGQESTVSLLT